MSGGIVGVVPVRSLTGGKTRLAGTLSPEMRAALTRRMLGGVLDALVEVDVCEAVAVVSPDPEVLALASARQGAIVPVRQDAAMPGLLPALEAGRSWALARGAGALLVLFGDLPLLTGEDVRNLVRLAAPVVIAPDRHGVGTNGLLLRQGIGGRTPAERFGFRFGIDSYARHVAEADRLGLEVVPSLVTGTAFDLDTADDWRAFTDRRLADDGPLEVGLGRDWSARNAPMGGGDFAVEAE